MSDLAMLIPIAAITIWPVSRVANNWIRARHGFEPQELQGRRNRDGGLQDPRKVELLASENERLTGQVLRLEERIAVLERIATDPAERISREIEALRSPALTKER